MLNVVYSNNMVQLAAHLADKQRSQPLPPLEAETVIVQSNELARWLSLFLARQHGIASHIDFPYPSAFIWALFRKVLPDIPKQSPYSTDAMAWRIYELLPQCRNTVGFEAVNNYLGQQDDALKTYALAHRIADSFDQYLMYRPDWIQAWQQGEKPHWQAMLWQLLTKGDNKPMHRANLLLQLKNYLSTAQQRPTGLPERLAIFGLSALPPVYLELFELMAVHCDIDLYFLSPSEHYWGDLLNPKTQAKQATELANDHPLLTSMGKQGQVFFEQLQQCQLEDEHSFVEPQQNRLLGALQYDIFTLKNIENNQQKQVIMVDDDSIVVHACHSVMREIEVLHDQLLALFERHPELSATDIVVMTPDVSVYAPCIDAVFGSATQKQKIAYGVADAGIKYQSPVLEAFFSLLNLPQSRFDVETVVDLLECEAIQTQFSLDEQQLELIRSWIRETQTRWGLSADDKTALDLPASETNTWRAGLDRLLLGYAMPMNEQALFDGKLGFDGISGEHAQTMAQLCAFIDSLDRFRQRLQSNFTAEQWQQQLIRLLDTFFLPSNDKTNDDAELLLTRNTLALLVETTELAQFKQTMTIDLVKEWLNEHLDINQPQTRFMGEGVTFCGMVPMRSIPFEVVCLIGMNDESYPRRQPTPGFDLLSDNYRNGDRSRRDEDRYLFLEAILSAQSQLYISYIGASIVDNSAIPPSVLVSDLRDCLQQYFELPEEKDIWQHVLTKHPLQAFSQRYFDGSSDKLFSYVKAHCPSADKSSELTSWFVESLPEADLSWRQINLKQLLGFFRHPAKYLLQHRLDLWLQTDEDKLENREPFALDGLQAWQLRQQLLSYRLQDKHAAQALPIIQATGVLPQGNVGDYVFNEQSIKVNEFADKLLPDYPQEFLTPANFELTIGKFSLQGQLANVSTSGLFSYRMGKTKGNQLLTVWIEHLILNCIKPAGVQCESRLITEDGDYHFLVVPESETILHDLLKLYWQGLHAPLPLFANTSYAFAKTSLNGGKANPESAMFKTWHGDQYHVTGEKEDLYYQQVYAEASPLDEQFKQLSLAIYQPLQAHLAGGKL